MTRHTHCFNESKSYCAETCPDVDSAFGDTWAALESLVAPSLAKEAENILDALCKTVKEVGTERLREALCAALSDKQDAEGERDDLQRKVDSLTADVDDLKDHVASLQDELREALA